jgi:hypothetical protein
VALRPGLHSPARPAAIQKLVDSFATAGLGN